MDHAFDGFAVAMRERAENLYKTGQYLCAESILLTLNKGFNGPLTDDEAVGLSAGMVDGMGGSGCLCGAVAGASLAIGLLLGRNAVHARRMEIRKAVSDLHAWFKKEHGSACCRVLVKKVKDDEAAHFRQCAELTGKAAEKAARIILERRPELARRIDEGYLAKRDSKLMGRFKWAARFLRR